MLEGKTVAVVGAGPGGLMAAGIVARAGALVTVLDRMPSPGRKFLMAGRGGLNITHGENLEVLLSRYGAASAALAPSIRAFPPEAVRDWCAQLAEPTFEGSSGRIFPRSFKASPLLRAWLRDLSQSVGFRMRHTFQGWADDGSLLFASPSGPVTVRPDATILALGGASWPRLGSDGGWTVSLAARGVAIAQLRPANCGFEVAWSEVLKQKFAGTPLKTIAISFDGRRVRGEAVLTAYGLEGGAIYALSSALREHLLREGTVPVEIDLRPDIETGRLTERLQASRGRLSLSSFLRRVTGLPPVSVALLREAGPLPADAGTLAARIKNLPLVLTGIRPLDRAISTAGGVSLSEIDDRFMLSRLPGVFCCGEMLDWEAPTGGYLLQATLSTAVAAGHGAVEWLQKNSSNPVI